MPGREDWSERRLKTTYEEVRAVLEAQNDTISDIDDKAMRTVRLAIILVGIIVAVARIDGPEIFHPYWFGTGLAFLLASVLIGVLTYRDSNLFIGPNRDYVEQLVNDDFQDTTWDRDLLVTYAEWIERNFEDVRWNSFLLYITQLLMLTGISFLTISIAF